MELFKVQLLDLVNRYAGLVPEPLRAQALLAAALAMVDAFKLKHASMADSCTEDEFAEVARQAFRKCRGGAGN